jgi:uncharacterized 2Fe-2S/4Fe-4S cluster protein (DUF4445 family)
MSDSVTTDKPDALVLFMPSGRRGRFKIGTPVLDAARTLGVFVESVCGGRGICGRCQVLPALGHFAKHGIESRADHLTGINAVERRYAEKRSLPADRRLSCQARVTGDLVIDVPTDVAINKQVVRKRAEVREVVRDLAIHLHYVEVEAPDMHHPLGDLDRVIAALKRDFNLPDLTCDLALLPRVQKILRAADFKVTGVVYTDDGAAPRLIDLRPGYSEDLYGVAIDIGSTTIACHLVDMMSGRTVASAGTSNPQIRFGEDLMSRVSYVMMNPDGRVALTDAVRGAVASLISRVAGEVGVAADQIMEAVFVGNPVMHHLFLGLDPTELGQAPFALAMSGPVRCPAREIGLALNPAARVYILPCIAGHVGADAAGVALSEGPQNHDETTLVVDVGTNAEILLGNRARVLAASSPTGPAFEGAEISAGQRAAPGAIERVRIDPVTLEPRIKVIGCDLWSDEDGFAAGTDAFGITGICGSGIIEVIGEMFLARIITPDGIIDPALASKSPRIVADGRTASYVLWHTSPSPPPSDSAIADDFPPPLWGRVREGGAPAAIESPPPPTPPHEGEGRTHGDKCESPPHQREGGPVVMSGGIEIRVTQRDVRAIQLAKAALYAGCRLLMDKMGVAAVERIKLAGAFGTYIDPKYAMIIGLIPDCDLSKVAAVGNAAGTGARMALLSRTHRREVETLVGSIEKIETALEPRFQEHFVAAMALPNKIEPFPRLAEQVVLPVWEAGGGEGGGGRRGRRRG